MKRPELAHRALRLATDHIIQAWDYWIETFGAERVSVGVYVTVGANQIMSPKQFEEFVMPYQAELHERYATRASRVRCSTSAGSRT